MPNIYFIEHLWLLRNKKVVLKQPERNYSPNFISNNICLLFFFCTIKSKLILVNVTNAFHLCVFTYWLYSLYWNILTLIISIIFFNQDNDNILSSISKMVYFLICLNLKSSLKLQSFRTLDFNGLQIPVTTIFELRTSYVQCT